MISKLHLQGEKKTFLLVPTWEISEPLVGPNRFGSVK